MGWYILQTVIVFGLIFVNIHYQWIDEPWLGFALSWGLAYVVTKLLSGLFFVVSLLRGGPTYGGQAHRDTPRLAPGGWHIHDPREQPLRLGIGNHVRDRVEISSRLPLRPKIAGQSRPLARRQNGLRRISKT
jgi:hypothetical protein